MVSDYLRLITSQHQNAPNYMAMLTGILQYVQDTQDCITQIGEAFDLSAAVGVQLDVLGLRVGVARLLRFQPAGGLIVMLSDGTCRTIEPSAIMDDDTYRTAIKAKIAQNQWDGTITGINALWNNLFAPRLQLILQDNQDMTLTVYVIGNITDLETQLLQNGYLIPKPEGVKISIGTPDYPIFAFDESITNYQGLDTGKWLKTT